MRLDKEEVEQQTRVEDADDVVAFVCAAEEQELQVLLLRVDPVPVLDDIS